MRHPYHPYPPPPPTDPAARRGAPVDCPRLSAGDACVADVCGSVGALVGMLVAVGVGLGASDAVGLGVRSEQVTGTTRVLPELEDVSSWSGAAAFL